MSTRSRAIPEINETVGPSDDIPGAFEATSAVENVTLAANPSALGSNHRKGPTDWR